MTVKMLGKMQKITLIYRYLELFCYITNVILTGADEHVDTSQTSLSTVLLKVYCICIGTTW